MSRYEMLSVGVFALARDPEDPARFALVQHAYNSGQWSLPGGRLEQGELVSVGLAREVKEETGLDVDIGQLIGIFSLKKKPGLVILHEATVVGGIVCPNDPAEIKQCRFLSVDDAFLMKDEIYPAQRAMITWSEPVRMGAVKVPFEGFLVPPLLWQTP
ncbi:MAG: NUDIX hydrolase [Patescibacteria group bacterium]